MIHVKYVSNGRSHKSVPLHLVRSMDSSPLSSSRYCPAADLTYRVDGVHIPDLILGPHASSAHAVDLHLISETAGAPSLEEGGEAVEMDHGLFRLPNFPWLGPAFAHLEGYATVCSPAKRSKRRGIVRPEDLSIVQGVVEGQDDFDVPLSDWTLNHTNREVLHQTLVRAPEHLVTLQPVRVAR